MGLRRIGRRFRRAFRRVTSFGKKIFKAVSKPLSIAKKILGPVSKILSKIPGGKLIASFAQKFLQNPLSLLSMAGLGPIGAIFSFATNSGSLAGLVKSLVGSIGGRTPRGMSNIMHLVAAQQARLYRN